ncbi:hypothetical protein Ciccas_011179 [Cichlidogyrus casuarinus]|uniref:Uncharacterized protein n=1 Tax=Cichlidogyrus casuarinus TaxID=1844966 RepID=A0ABD2PS11_9PLAT
MLKVFKSCSATYAGHCRIRYFCYETEKEDQGTLLKDSREAKSHKYTFGIGGDINSCELLGTISNVTTLQMVKRPEKEWLSIFVNTKFISDDGHQVNTHNRIHVFDARLLPIANRLKIGDKAYFSGFYSYYKPASRPSGDHGSKGYRIGAMIANRIIPMTKDSISSDELVD